MAAGLPVIAPDEGGPAAVISDGTTGRLFPIGDQRALAKLMRELRDDPRQGERLAIAGRESLAAYRPEAIARRVEDVYSRVLGRSGAGPDL
jgi:phosphatidylinositol alpha-mannosyltransferase